MSHVACRACVGRGTARVQPTTGFDGRSSGKSGNMGEGRAASYIDQQPYRNFGKMSKMVRHADSKTRSSRGCAWLASTAVTLTRPGPVVVTPPVRRRGAATCGRSRPQDTAAARGRRTVADGDGSECGGRVWTPRALHCEAGHV
jgi:hypothetical protein